MAETFTHKYIFNTVPVNQNEEGQPEYKIYSAIQTWSSQELPEGYVWFDMDGSMGKEFYKENRKIAGLVDFTLSEDGTEVASVTYNDTYYQNYLNTLPAWSETGIQSKISELSRVCQQTIENGTDVTFDESQAETTTFHFDFTTEDQANINSLFNTILLGATEFPYHYKDGNCQTFTREQIMTLYITMQKFITHNITYNNQLKNFIVDSYTGSRDEEDEVACKAITYGETQLTGTYLETYNQMMQVANTQVQNIITSLSSTLNL